MKYLCLDFEGVLIPEIWQQVAEATNSKDLMLTTQDLKDYDELMQLRMNVKRKRNKTKRYSRNRQDNGTF